jgi:site-specific DNA-methyltransferase (adenine-specific)
MIIQGDCMIAMKDMPDKAFDLAIVDPPYGISVNHSLGRRAGDRPSLFKPCRWDCSPPSKEYFNELFRVSQNQIIWGANHFMDLICRRSPCWVVWDKLFSEDVSFASCELAFTSFDSVTKRISLSSVRSNGIHPTQKPVRLYEWLLKNYAQPEHKILDTYLGSGSSAIASYNLGFDFTGYEIDEEYFNAAKKRLERHIRQGRLFEPETKTIDQANWLKEGRDEYNRNGNHDD